MPYYRKPKTTPKLVNPVSTRRASLLDEIGDTQLAKIIAYIQAGAFKHQAAKACGVTPVTFSNWLKIGKDDIDNGRNDTSHARFYSQVTRASGEARIVAEMKVRELNPLAWLKYAARSTSDEPGWTDDVRIIEHVHSGDANNPILIEQVDTRRKNMTEAIQLLSGLGLDPAKITDQRATSVLHDDVIINDVMSTDDVDDT